MSEEWPFAESLDESLNLDTWTETTELHAVPPNVAARMRELGATREPSETGLPLTTAALSSLVLAHWPAPAVDALRVESETSVSFRWLNFDFVVHTNLFVEQYHVTPEGRRIEPAVPQAPGRTRELWLRTNTATRAFERILRLALEGNPPRLVVLDEAGVRRLLEEQPDRPYLFWRGSKVGHGMIGLCGRHVRAWPQHLGQLRLAHLSPQLHADLACSSGAAIQSVARDIHEFYTGRRRGCRACHYEQEYASLSPFHGLEPVGPGQHGFNFDDGHGPLSYPEYGQPRVTFMQDVAQIPFTCERCGAVKPRLEGTPCEGCGKGICLDCLAANTECPHCHLCALCGAGAGEGHDQRRHDEYLAPGG